jgi:hypothetical protein
MASSFALDVSKWVEKAKDRGDLVLRKVALDVGQSVVQMSPVKTGRFRANWYPGIGYAQTITTAETDTTGGKSIARITGLQQSMFAGQVVFISNSLPYSVRLENGSSKQAPNGMVRVTVERFQGIVNSAIAEAKSEKP